MTFTKFKLVTAYIFIVGAVIIYVFAQTKIYSIYNDIENRKDSITEVKDRNDILKIRINSMNSREQIMKENPSFEIRDNIFYLESYE